MALVPIAKLCHDNVMVKSMYHTHIGITVQVEINGGSMNEITLLEYGLNSQRGTNLIN